MGANSEDHDAGCAIHQNFACSCSPAASPDCGESHPRTEPDPRYTAQQNALRHIANDSLILDSRVNYWSWRMGVDPGLRRAALKMGYVVRFTVLEGTQVRTHVIHPKELR